jgi:hypothetical protein
LARRSSPVRPAPRSSSPPPKSLAPAPGSPPETVDAGGRARFWTRTRVALAVLVLLLIHLTLAIRSLVLENPTVDEVVHLPAGITYWEKGTFRLYRHNPPLIKLIAALPVLAARPVTQPIYATNYWNDEPPNKAAIAHLFAQWNAARYFELFARARVLMPVFSIVGALVVFAWSSRLYGAGGGLLSLALWVFCPNVLAHCRLITTDVGATALGVLATFVFWLYLKRPSWWGATGAGICLGMAQLAKFSLILFYGLWLLLWLVHLAANPQSGLVRRIGRGLAQGAWMLVVSILVIDVGYQFEGVGIPLGRYEFTCQTLTRPVPPGMSRPESKDRLLNGAWKYRVNRFRGTWLESLPVPLPKHYMLGFDDQKLEAEGIPKKFLNPGLGGDELMGYPVYLNGTLSQTSWWYYYLLALAYKVPEGTWILVVPSLVVLAASPRARATWFDELALLAVPVVVLVVISFFTNINLGLRYVLPIFPYVFISAGRLVPWAAGLSGRARQVAAGVVGASLLATVASTLWIHPHYLAYFNMVSGGPIHGSEHMIDSSLDWGQDLVTLRRWVQEHTPGEKVGLAYFGQINPQIFDERAGEGFSWFLPPPRPRTMNAQDPLPSRDRLGPRMNRLEPGLYAVSASLLRGLPWRVYDNDPKRWAPYEAWFDAFSYFRELTPIGHVGYSIFLYRVTAADAERLGRHWPDEGPRPGG